MKKPLQNITISGVKYDVFDAIPTEENKLIYYKQKKDELSGELSRELLAEYLMYTDGLVVNNDEDFELCQENADVSMSTVSKDWIKWGNDDDSKWWGYYPSDSSKTGQKMDNSTYNYTYINFYMNGQPEGYIYNTKNTDSYTGYYSKSSFEDYTSHLSVGIMSENGMYSTRPGQNDNASVVPVLNIDETNGIYYGISISIMNSKESSSNQFGPSRLYINNGGEHTISIICWKLNDLQVKNEGFNLLSREEGLSIIPYQEEFNNCSSTGLASVIQTKIKKENDILTLWFSDPYSTYDDDGNHQVHIDRPVIINLNNYTVTFTDMSGKITTKNFSNDDNIVEIFKKLCGGAKRGYEVYSNPGSIFRNMTSDELILNMSPDTNYNTTWKHSQDNGWVNVSEDIGKPMELFTGSKLSFNRLTNKLFYSDGTDVTHIANIGDKTVQKLPSVNVDTDLTTLITLSNLKTLRDGGLLIPGMKYRITDYVTTVNPSLTDVQSAGHVFDIIVEADDKSTLNENVRFIQHSGDTYFSGCTLESWEGKYCIDNDTTRFDWADETNGKGVIYWLKDEYNNECPYDFKNIQFKRIAITDVQATGITSDMLSELQTTFVYERNGGICYGQVDHYGSYVPSNVSNNNSQINYTFADSIDSWYYTFTWVNNSGDTQDASIVGQRLINDEGQYSGVFNNQIQPVSQSIFYPDSPNEFGYSLNNIVFISSYSYDGGFFNGCYGNKFGVNCEGNTFGNYCNCNTFGSECYNNTFGYLCNYNTFGNRCKRNTLGNYCWSNTLGNDCWSNTLGKYCDYNIFGNYCQNNTLGNNCEGNTFGNNCWSNTFGNYCNCNTFGNGCANNTLGNNCEGNTFGNNCYRNTFGNDYMYGCRFGDNVQYCKIGDYVTTGSNQILMNIIVLNGTKGNYNNILNLDMVEKIEDDLSYQVSSFTYNVSKSTTDMIPSVTCGYVWNSEHTQVIYQVKNNFETI